MASWRYSWPAWSLVTAALFFSAAPFLFNDGLAWLSQITMFVMLGLLIKPESLFDVWLEGLMIALVLIFIARPLAVIPVLKLSGFNTREITLVSWVGLRGSVPIILAIFPLMYNLPGADLIFNVVFFVVLLSATVQGSTLPYMARKLRLTEIPRQRRRRRWKLPRWVMLMRILWNTPWVTTPVPPAGACRKRLSPMARWSP